MKQQAFTLIELIVTITILAILGALWFFSMKDFVKDSRNSVRITDINTIKNGLSIFYVKNNFYPTPDNTVNITYSWWILWKQWTYGINTFRTLKTISERSLDPLFQVEYWYSITNQKDNYELYSIMEWKLLLQNNITPISYALLEDKQTYANGNYIFTDLKSEFLWNCWLISTPGLHINTINMSSNILDNQSYNFALQDSLNIHSSYSWKVIPINSWNTFHIKEVLNSCSISSLAQLSQYISDLSNNYQQLSSIEKYKELIYNSNTKDFMLTTLNLLQKKWIAVQNNIQTSVENNNFFNDNFSNSDNNSLISQHSSIDGNWLYIWWIPDNYSYKIFNNQLQKTAPFTAPIYPNPYIPLSSPDTNTIFQIKDFATGNIIIYARYTDSNNHYRLELNNTGYKIISKISGVDNTLQDISDPINIDDTIEFSIIGSNIKLYINAIQKENIVDLSILTQWLSAISLENTGAKIDNYSLIYN